jgi:hypothetical protein
MLKERIPANSEWMLSILAAGKFYHSYMLAIFLDNEPKICSRLALEKYLTLSPNEPVGLSSYSHDPSGEMSYCQDLGYSRDHKLLHIPVSGTLRMLHCSDLRVTVL